MATSLDEGSRLWKKVLNFFFLRKINYLLSTRLVNRTNFWDEGNNDILQFFFYFFESPEKILKYQNYLILIFLKIFLDFF